MTLDTVIYTRSDWRYFPGLVGLLGSLQRLGVDRPVYLVDTGLTDAQRRYVATLADVRVARPNIEHYRLDGSKVARYNSTVFAGLEVQFPHHDVLVHLDADAVVLGSLGPLVEAANDHGFAATGEIPPSNLGTHFWGMPAGTGRALQDVSRAEQETAFGLIGEDTRFDGDSITFNSGIWATRVDYFTEQLGPRLARYAPLHREIWGLEQAMLNIACFYANPAEPFREVGSAFNSRADYAYFNEHYAESGYRIAPPRVIDPPSAILGDGPFRLNGVGGQLRVLHYVWKPKPWESDDVPLAAVWRAFADRTGDWEACAGDGPDSLARTEFGTWHHL